MVDTSYHIWMLQHWLPAVQRDANEATAHKQQMVSGNSGGSASLPLTSSFPEPPPIPTPGIQKRLFSQIARIKASANYNQAIGQILGIIAIPTTVDRPVPEFVTR